MAPEEVDVGQDVAGLALPLLALVAGVHDAEDEDRRHHRHDFEVTCLPDLGCLFWALTTQLQNLGRKLLSLRFEQYKSVSILSDLEQCRKMTRSCKNPLRYSRERTFQSLRTSNQPPSPPRGSSNHQR